MLAHGRWLPKAPTQPSQRPDEQSIPHTSEYHCAMTTLSLDLTSCPEHVTGGPGRQVLIYHQRWVVVMAQWIKLQYRDSLPLGARRYTVRVWGQVIFWGFILTG